MSGGSTFDSHERLLAWVAGAMRLAHMSVFDLSSSDPYAAG